MNFLEQLIDNYDHLIKTVKKYIPGAKLEKYETILKLMRSEQAMEKDFPCIGCDKAVKHETTENRKRYSF